MKVTKLDMNESRLQRFWEKVAIKGEDECIGLALVEQLKNGVEKAIDRPRGDVVTISHLGAFQGEIHAIRQCVTVHQYDGFGFGDGVIAHNACPH